MDDSICKPRLTRFEDLVVVIRELRSMGITGGAVYRHVTDIGPVDLDLLADVLACENPSRPASRPAARFASPPAAPIAA